MALFLNLSILWNSCSNCFHGKYAFIHSETVFAFLSWMGLGLLIWKISACYMGKEVPEWWPQPDTRHCRRNSWDNFVSSFFSCTNFTERWSTSDNVAHCFPSKLQHNIVFKAQTWGIFARITRTAMTVLQFVLFFCNLPSHPSAIWIKAFLLAVSEGRFLGVRINLIPLDEENPVFSSMRPTRCHSWLAGESCLRNPPFFLPNCFSFCTLLWCYLGVVVVCSGTTFLSAASIVRGKWNDVPVVDCAAC